MFGADISYRGHDYSGKSHFQLLVTPKLSHLHRRKPNQLAEPDPDLELRTGRGGRFCFVSPAGFLYYLIAFDTQLKIAYSLFYPGNPNSMNALLHILAKSLPRSCLSLNRVKPINLVCILNSWLELVSFAYISLKLAHFSRTF